MTRPHPYLIEARTDGGFAVRVDACYQPNDPDMPGDEHMSRERALAVAGVLAQRLGYDAGVIGDAAEA